MPWATTSAMGSAPSSSARSRLITTRAAPPSEICDAFPAVIVPSGLKAGRSRARPSAVVSARMPSSRSTTTGSPLRWGTWTGTTSSANRPASQASWARWWLRAAQASWSSREIRRSSLTSSESSPISCPVNVEYRPS